MQITIPCATYVRHAEFTLSGENWYKTIRYDNGKLISIDQHGYLMVVEKIDGPEGLVQLKSDQATIDVCKQQAELGADLIIDVSEESKWATGYTSHGVVISDNMGVWDIEGSNKSDLWRKVVDKIAKPPKEVEYGMFWTRSTLEGLAIVAPTGNLLFEKLLGFGGRPTLVTDMGEPNWFAVLQPWKMPEHPKQPKLPDWLS